MFRKLFQPKTKHFQSNLLTASDARPYSLLVIKSEFTSQVALDPDPFNKSYGSVMGFKISIFRQFENSQKGAVLTKI